jgi:hypothetical protein
MACVGATLKGILSVHRWRGGELDRRVGNNVAMRHAGACQRTLPRRAKGWLCPGLDDALLAPAARSVKRTAQGPHHRAVGTSIPPTQREARRSAYNIIDKTPCCTSGDAMMLGGRHTGGGIVVRRNRRMDGSVTGNSPAMTRGRRAREGNLGGRGIRWVGPAHQRWQSGNGRQAGLACEDGPGHCRSKPARRKTTREAFFFFEFLSHLNFHL